MFRKEVAPCKITFNSDCLNLLPVTFHTGQSDVFTAGDASIGSVTLLHYDRLDARPFFIACCSAPKYLTTLLPRQVRSRNSLLFYSLPFFEWENCCPNVIIKKKCSYCSVHTVGVIIYKLVVASSFMSQWKLIHSHHFVFLEGGWLVQSYSDWILFHLKDCNPAVLQG